MLKGFYKFLTTQRLSKLDLFDNLELARRYGMVRENENGVYEEVFDGSMPVSYKLAGFDEYVSSPVFIQVTSETTCAFYGNLMFAFSYDPEPGDYILRIFIKKPEDKWTFTRNNSNGCYVLNPTNVHAEVYVAYNVSVLKLSRCIGDDYKSGTWNKRFYNDLVGFVEKTNAYTEINQMKEAYKK